MPSTVDYYNTLKTQLETQATNKKLALDAAYLRATTAQFDSQGNMTRKKDASGQDLGPGTLDVQYDEQQRQMSGGAENSGTLKSGQYGRELAASQAAYRTAVVGGAADTEAQKTAIENETGSELAKYQAMYGNVATAAPTTGGGTTNVGSTKPKNVPTSTTIAPPPVFNPGGGVVANKPVPRTDANGRGGMGATLAKPAPIVKKPVPVPTKVPVPPKIKNIKFGM
jgi:hypothetical protein